MHAFLTFDNILLFQEIQLFIYDSYLSNVQNNGIMQ